MLSILKEFPDLLFLFTNKLFIPWVILLPLNGIPDLSIKEFSINLIKLFLSIFV
jgi:hypothetical protein